ncbi:hypothetical protein SeMB42_g07530 [Synchytrium endobioticum]|nr:hypothetical protein SeMB42_g07530 [Synchytrium endobioticum]
MEMNWQGITLDFVVKLPRSKLPEVAEPYDSILVYEEGENLEASFGSGTVGSSVSSGGSSFWCLQGIGPGQCHDYTTIGYFAYLKLSSKKASYSQAIRSSSTMLTCFIIVLVLWHQALPTSAETTDTQYRAYAQSLLEYRYGMTLTEKMRLENEFQKQYLKWRNPNNPYGSGITSVTELWIQNIIPSDIPFTVEDARYQPKKESPGRNEFVWEGLRTLNDIAYVGVDDVHREELEDLRVFATTAEDYLKTHIRLQFLQSDGVSDLLALSADVARIFLALESHHRPWVSSFTQVELIKTNWLKWCVDELNIGEKLARLTQRNRHTPRMSTEEWVEAFASIQLAAGRIEMFRSSLEKFNENQSSIPIHQLVNDMDVLGKAFADYAQKYRSITWEHVLGTEARRYLGIIASAPPATPGLNLRKVTNIPDEIIVLFHLLPTPENVQLEYLRLAEIFHLLVWNRGQSTEGDRDDERGFVLGDAYHLYQKFEEAANAPRSPDSADSTDDFIWVERWKDAKLLRHAYAKAVDTRYRSYAESLREYIYGMTGHKELQIKEELTALYFKWISSNDPYSATSITGLLIDRIIPKGIPFMVENVREPTDDMSLAYIEFVWASLMALDKFAYLFAEVNRAFQRDEVAKAYEKRLKAEIPLALGGSNDVFSPSDIDEFDQADMNFRITRVHEALTFGTFSMVSSIVQAELIERYWSEWCFGKIAVALYRHDRYRRLPWLGQAFPSSQLALGRMQLLELSLNAFLEQRKQLPQTEWSEHVVRGVERTVATMQSTMNEVTEMYRRDNEARQIYPGYEVPELMDLLPTPDASAASLSGGAGPSSNPVMDEHVGVNSAAAHDHGLSTDHFQGLSLDTSRTMTEHGQARTRRSRRQRSGTGSSNLEYRG